MSEDSKKNKELLSQKDDDSTIVNAENDKDSSYDESTIQVLEGTEGVRLRPAMYIGDVGVRGLHHLVYEVIDNSIDEAMANRCSKVDVKIHPDNSVSLLDDGAGIPAGIHPKYGVSTLEVILTKLHSGGKFEKKAYQVSGGLHGVGLAVVCALSEWFIVKSYRDGLIFTQRYERGKKASEVTTEPLGDHLTGTLIHFKPDTTIFSVIEYDNEILVGRFRELAYLTTKFTINFFDSREDADGNTFSETFYAEGGIKQFVSDIIKNNTPIMKSAPIFYGFGITEGVVVEISLSYTNSYQPNILGFVNNINTTEGGTHIAGFRTVLTRTINKFARDFKILKEKDNNLTGNDVREGIVAIISVKAPNPQFRGQTKTKLGNSEIDGYVQSAIGDPLKNWLIDNQDMGKAIVEKAILARKASEAARKARDKIRKPGGRVSLPGKLFPSRTKDPLKRELFLVEGQSAGGTAVSARDSEFQEILFLRGKVLNVEKARIDRAMENQEIRNIIAAIGSGYIGSGDQGIGGDEPEFKISKCRYGKVILLTDADVDGAHIATLLLTFFYRFMKPLIEDGRLYIARPPLYLIKFSKKAKEKMGSDELYLASDWQLENIYDHMKEQGLKRSEMKLSRFKGLGEMNADQLETTATSVMSRNIEQILIADAFDAEQWLVKLMGDEVEHRKKFISSDVFVETGQELRGPFYDAGFGSDKTDTDILTSEEIYSEGENEAELDELGTDQGFLKELEQFEF